MKVQLTSENHMRWYLATITMVVTIEGQLEKVIHKNLHLIQAGSDDSAYNKAVELGNDSETSYLNSKDQLVDLSFHGLDELEETTELDIYDGVELRFEEFEDVSSEQLNDYISHKTELSVFSSNKRNAGDSNADYGSKEVRDYVNKTLNHEK